jgi:PPK2 family polyphosphate:nucleotide phosphotransferase
MKACEQFRAGARLRLREQDAGETPLRDKNGKDSPKERERAATAALIEQIGVLQEMLFAQRKHKLLVLLQGMDTSGKDGTIKALFSGVSPIGMRVYSFRAPSAEELAHDFLWRIHQRVPGYGEIVIFNRSHYEDVLVAPVLGLIDNAECKRRHAQICDFERMLAEHGTVIVKIFLHISNGVQRMRLQERLDDPNKQWKFDPHDIEQRKHWDDFQRCYERAITATNTDQAPWYVVPADSKTHRNLIIANILLETLQGLKLAFPAPDPAFAKLQIE